LSNPGEEQSEFPIDLELSITGEELLLRVEADVKDRISRRNIVAVIETGNIDHQKHLLIYDNIGYALISLDGSVSGMGPIRTETENIVVLCSMTTYEVPEFPTGGFSLDTNNLSNNHDGIGNKLLQILGLSFILIGLFLLFSPLFLTFPPGSGILTTVSALGFIFTGLFLLIVVVHSRLSDRFRSMEYHDRLAKMGIGSDFRPDFLPPFDKK
tara:strand:- start:7136 stop:7771 length:636 start_codon:yes stop_codon:yes gene_type:complete